MSMIQFVRNYDDLSTDKGFQFKFQCDQCGNGFMSKYETSTLGMASSLLRAAGDIFGGWATGAANSAYDIQRSVGGKAHDSALAAAIESKDRTSQSELQSGKDDAGNLQRRRGPSARRAPLAGSRPPASSK